MLYMKAITCSCLFIDPFYVSAHSNYQHEHYAHPIFIYGYDMQKKEYYAGEFFNRKFEFRPVDMEQLESAFENCDDTNNIPRGISLLGFNPSALYPFDLDFFKQCLSDFLGSRCPSVGFKADPESFERFGVEAEWSKITQQISQLKSDAPFDLRVFPIVREQKKVLRIAWKYILEQNIIAGDPDLSSHLEELERRFLLLQNMVIKFMISRDQRILERIGKGGEPLRSFEIDVLDMFRRVLP